MSSPFKIFAGCIVLIHLLIFSLDEAIASPDTSQLIPLDTFAAPHISSTDKIDTLINKNEPPIFINKFSKFKRLFDKIIAINGDTLTVLVNKVSQSTVEFNFPLNYRNETMNKNLIRSLIYSDGTIELMSLTDTTSSPEKEEPVKYTEKDWDKVVVLVSLDEAAGAQDLGIIESKFEGDRINVNAAYLEKSCLILLKKKAARLGANYIYISNRDEYSAYGELPSITLTAHAFRK